MGAEAAQFLKGRSCFILGFGGSHQVRILSSKFVKKPVMNAKTICNLTEATKFLCPIPQIPLPIRVIILKFSGHLQVGHRSIAFVVY